MAADSTASATWEGDLLKGKGVITSTGSGVVGDLPVTWASRTERSRGMTSPEELIAAAHASCFNMGLSHGLSQQGTPPERLETSATATFVPGTGITTMRLVVRGRVPGLDQAGFEAAAAAARDGCPVSKALKGNVDISVDATLEG